MSEYLKPEAWTIAGRRFGAWRTAIDRQDEAPLLLCLHPMPYSGAFFAPASPYLSRNRALLCPDYPGFGESEPLEGEWTIEAWADALPTLLDYLAIEAPVDVLGFHTGCLVGPAMALAHSARVRRMVLVDVPYFDPEQRENLGEKTANAARYVGKPIAIRGFRTAFAFDPVPSFKKVEHPTLVIGTDSSLHGPSEAAARAIPGARFLGRPDIGAPVFESGAERIADCVDTFLDEVDRLED